MTKFRKAIIFSTIITLPISTIFLIIVIKSYVLKTESYKFAFYNNNNLHIKTIATLEYMNLKNQILFSLGIAKKSAANIIIDNSKINKLLKDLPMTGFEDKKAVLAINNGIYVGKARFRGDTFYHWFYPQQSWRFKMSKNNLIDGVRKYNFITPKSTFLINNHISYLLAREIGLLAPESSMLTLSVNGVYNGIKMKVEQIDESFLRRNRRMPNDIYKGDNIASSHLIGVNSNIFNTASIWEKSSYNNHYDQDNRVPLTRLLENFKNRDYSIYDINSFAKFATYIDIVGTYHHDEFHNWMLYYDHYYEKMFPIVWDSAGFSNLEKNTNIISSKLLLNLYKNYNFLKLKYHNLKSFSLNHSSNYINKINNAKLEVQKILNDTNIGAFNMSRRYQTPEWLENKLNEFIDLIIKRINNIEDEYLGKVNGSDYMYSLNENSLRLSLKGNKLVNQIKINLSKIIKIENITISYFVGDVQVSTDLSFDIEDENLIIPIELLSRVEIVSDMGNKKQNKVEYKEATYDITFNEKEVIQNIERVTLKFLTIDNEEKSIKKSNKIDKKYFNESSTDIIDHQNTNSTLVFKNQMSFNNFNVIKDNLLIEKGTKLIFNEGATLKVLGKVTAIGTKENPIIFQALDDTKPWGAFALKDEAANGSVFKHVIFKGGSGNKGDMHEYTAMLSIHNVKDVLIENTEFYDSKITDDMVHVIYSEVIFKNSKFIRSLSDALDVDISNVVVDNCEFIDSGNDSIDLMTTNAIVTNTRFYNSLDKGISIGEGSNLIAANNLIVASEIGMQSKDTSKAYIYNTSFIDNKKAIDAYHKNWRYSEGGTIYLDKIILQGNEVNATVGKKSHVTINDSQIDTPNNFDKKDIQKEKIIISNKDYIPYDFDEVFLQNKDHLIEKQRQGYNE